MFFLYEQVQAKILPKCGWLLGSHPGVFNVTNMSEVIDEIHLFDTLRVEFRIQKVDSSKDSPKAAVIYCNWDQASKVRISSIPPRTRTSFPMEYRCPLYLTQIPDL